MLAGTLTLDNRVYKQLQIRIRQGGLDIDAAAADGARVDGILYPVGPSKDLTGYLRDSVTAIPDGFHGTRTAQNVAIKPDTFSGVKTK